MTQAHIVNADWMAVDNRRFEEGEVEVFYHGPTSVIGTGREQCERTKWVQNLLG